MKSRISENIPDRLTFKFEQLREKKLYRLIKRDINICIGCILFKTRGRLICVHDTVGDTANIGCWDTDYDDKFSKTDINSMEFELFEGKVTLSNE